MFSYHFFKTQCEHFNVGEFPIIVCFHLIDADDFIVKSELESFDVIF